MNTLQRASGMASKINDFDTFFGLKLAYLIFSAEEQLSINIQSKGYHCTRGSLRCSASYHYLRSLRNEKRLFFFIY